MQRTIIFLLIALLLPSVSAQDFLAFGDTTVNVLPCGSEVRSVTIQNTRGTQSSYTLSVDGDASDYVTFSALSFTLNPGQSATISTFYNIPCTVSPDTYLTNIYFSDGETEKVLTQDVIVAIPDNINVTLQQNSAVIAPCETAGYTFELHNPLNLTEIYAVSAAGHTNVHVSEKNVVLLPNDRKNIIISVTPDDCTQAGTFPLTVDIESEKSNQHETYNLELIIKSTDIPVLAEGITRIRTDYEDSTAEITIENTGDRITQYSLSIEGATWATIDPNTVSLNPGQSKTLALRLAPTEETSPGTYHITLFATVEQTGIRYSKDFTIALRPETLFEKNPALVIAIIVVIVAIIAGIYYLAKYLRSPAFKGRLQRWKEKREARKKAKAQKRAELLKRKLELQRREMERKQAERERIKKQMERKVEKAFKKDHHVVAKKDLIVGKTKTDRARIYSIILGAIALILLAIAWPLIAPNIAYAVLGIAILAIIFIAKKLARSRTIRINWKYLPENTEKTINAWKKGLKLLSIESEKAVKKFKLLVRKTRAKAAPSPAVYQTFQYKTNTPEEVLSTRATFSISKSWLAKKGAELEDVRLARYSNQTWNTIQIKKTGESKEAIFFTADISKYGTYSIYARAKKQPMPTSQKITWIFVGIALLVAIAIALSPQPQVTHGIPPQVWQEDMVHSLDLSKYFKDPDNDELTFTTTETSHITIDIAGSTAFMTPETGWTGEERVRFSADDGKGGVMTSNTVPLRVQKVLIPARVQPYIAIILAIIAIILLILSVRLQKKA
jgi:PGF-pre-PGF domain-containing protein